MDGRSCNKCAKFKPAEAFETNGKMPDGSTRLRSICKDCGSRRKLERPEARRCTICKKKKEAHEFSDTRSSWCKLCKNQRTYRYRQGPGRAAHNTAVAERFKRLYTTDASFRQKHQARQAVVLAVKIGMLMRPARCPQCKRKCKVHGHHHKGYGKKHYLDVKWLCPSCHYKEDNP